MTKLPFSRVLLSVALASTFAVTGCDVRNNDDSKPTASTPTALTTAPYTQGTHPVFDVALGQLPLVTDIPFLAAAGALGANFDGTALVAAAADPVRIAINDLDGWSTDAYFDIPFSGTIDETSVHSSGANQNVFLVKLNTSGDALDPGNIVATNPVLPTGQPSYTHAVVDLDGGTKNAIRIIPQAPLDPAAKYLVFLTSTITDGVAPTTESTSYHALTDAGGAAVTTSLQGISQVLIASRQIAANVISAATGGVVSPAAASSLVTVSYTFTTTDPHKPLVAMAAPRAAVMSAGATMLEAQALDGGGLLSTPKARPLDVSPATATDLNALSGGALAANVADLYTGYITIPYYLAAPTSTSDFTHLARMWRADTTLASQLGVTLPHDVSQAVSGGPTTDDGTTNVTYRYPFAQATGTYNGSTGSKTETIPLQVTLPDKTYSSAALGGATCGTVEAAQSGYPVVIYVHGITSDRTSVIALAHALAQMCIATVAIDLPMHGIDSNSAYAGSLNVNHGSISAAISPLYGSTVAAALRERHFDETLNSYNPSTCPSGSLTPVPAAMNFSSPNCYDDSGSLFINLSNLQNTRDNLKEGVQDLLNLNASLSTLGAKDLDADGTADFNLGKVYVIGVSLGAMVSTTFTAVNQLAIAQDMAAGFTPNLNPVKGLVASAGGSQLTQILLNSPTFGPTIRAGLSAAGATTGSSSRASFLNVAQATVDSADPVNFAGILGSGALGALNVPTLAQMIIGGGDTTGIGDSTTWIADTVVPNAVVNPQYDSGAAMTGITLPLAGTAPYAALLGAGATADGTSNDATAGNLLAELTIGYHTSLLTPNPYTSPGSWTNGEKLATAELQTEAASFVLSGASAFWVGQAGSGLAGSYTTP